MMNDGSTYPLILCLHINIYTNITLRHAPWGIMLYISVSKTNYTALYYVRERCG